MKSNSDRIKELEKVIYLMKNGLIKSSKEELENKILELEDLRIKDSDKSENEEAENDISEINKVILNQISEAFFENINKFLPDEKFVAQDKKKMRCIYEKNNLALCWIQPDNNNKAKIFLRKEIGKIITSIGYYNFIDPKKSIVYSNPPLFKTFGNYPYIIIKEIDDIEYVSNIIKAISENKF